jgi:hypothetical protein
VWIVVIKPVAASDDYVDYPVKNVDYEKTIILQ